MAEQYIGALASKIVDRWAWWRAALKNPAAIGKTLPVHESEPNQGYFRVKNRDKSFDPVAIFYPEGSDELVAYRAGREVRPDEVWTWCCRSPVTFEDYTAASEGKGWPDDDATVAEQIKTPEPGIGDNSGEVDPIDALKDQIDAALKGLDAYQKISDDKTAAKAQSLRNRLNELSGDAEKIRVKQKEPHLEAGKAVDAKWQPLVKSAKAGADRVRDAIGSWETAKLQEQRKREKEDRDRLAAEQAAREQTADTAVMEAPAPVSAPVTAPEAAPVPIKPTYGKSASVSIKLVVTEVTDWAALSTFMLNHPDLQNCLRDLAQRATDKGHTVPGVKVEEKAAVR